MIRLYAASSNRGKLREFRLAAERYPDLAVDLMPGFELHAPCVEDGATFEENATLKARYYGEHVSGPLFADDSGLAVDALAGAPGIYSARFAGPDADDSANNDLLLEKLQGVSDRAAQFVCVIAILQEGSIQTFRGTVQGEITHDLRGAGGFGYDPLFYYPPLGCTFGELTAEQKLAVSHRGAALRSMFEFLAASRVVKFH